MNTTQQPTTRVRPVIRLFVSSTFSDMRHERNALQKDVFPKLEEFCSQNGFQFQAIDLRWGVSSEAGLDHRTMQICFDELRRAQEISPKPNFLILLGNRYGWRPLPEEISVAEFQDLERAAGELAPANGTDRSPATVLREWYRLDENAVPPVHLFQSRRQRLPDAKDYTQDGPWNEVQAALWEIINRAFPPEQLKERFDGAAFTADAPPPPIVRFQASATEQEIWQGALRVPDAPDHVLAFFRQIENVGGFSEPARIRDFVDLDPSGNLDADISAEEERLKDELRKRLRPDNLFETKSARLALKDDSHGVSAADVTTAHLTQLCRDVERRMTAIIQGQIDEYWNQTAKASPERAARELQIEQDEHARFGRERGGAASFVGRETELQLIRDYLQDDSRLPLVLHGSSGCGKTALLARAAEESQAEGAAPAEVLVRFIGVTPRSSDLRSLLGSLCQQLRLRHPREGEVPADISALREEFHDHLRSATPERPIILFLDALDQLSDADGGRLLHWIPQGALPPQVKLVVSCLSDRAEVDPVGQPYAELKRRQIPPGHFLNLDALSEEVAGRLLLERWLPQAGRTVSPEQRKLIEQRLASPACRLPIYLKLLFEEARLWPSYPPPRDLGEGVPALLAQLFARLSLPANHGPLLVNRVLGYLGASRHGLAENEILEILFRDPEYKTALDHATEQTRHELPARPKRIPIAIWSRLRFDLAPYLTERAAQGANVLTFYHRQVAEWVEARFTRSPDQTWQPHSRLADYFRRCAVSARSVVELPWQLCKARNWHQLHNLLAAPNGFVSVWVTSESDMLRYWSHLEAESPYRVAEAYRDAASTPHPWGATETTAFRFLVADFLMQTGNLELAASLYRLLIDYYRASGDDAMLHRCLGNYAGILHDKGKIDDADDLHAEAQELAKRNNDLKSYAIATAARASILSGRGKYDEADQMYLEAERIRRELDGRRGLAFILGNRAGIRFKKGDLPGAMTLLHEQQRIALEAGAEEIVAASLLNEGELHVQNGQIEKASQCYSEAEQIAHDLGLKELFGRCLLKRASIAEHQHRFDEALNLLTQAEATFREIGHTTCIRDAVGNQGVVHLLSRRPDDALRCYRESESMSRELGDEAGVATALGNQAMVFWDKGNGPEALEFLQDAEQISRELGDVHGVVFALFNQARINHALNNLNEAEEQISGCRALAEGYGLRRWQDEIAKILNS